MQTPNPELVYVQITAWAAIAAVIANVVMVFFQILSSKQSTKVQLLLQLTQRYDDKQMRDNRKELAHALTAGTARPTETQIEAVIDHLETIADLTHRGWLDKRLVYNFFSVSIRHWWEAVKIDIQAMRRSYHDTTLYEELEKLANTYNQEHLKRKVPPIGVNDLQIFLKSESA
jgi:Domain of unknown function (DUF4760)